MDQGSEVPQGSRPGRPLQRIVGTQRITTPETPPGPFPSPFTPPVPSRESSSPSLSPWSRPPHLGVGLKARRKKVGRRYLKRLYLDRLHHSLW